jgi:hypothetical protein
MQKQLQTNEGEVYEEMRKPQQQTTETLFMNLYD